MNYLEQIVGFHRWKEVNPLPASAIALWHELMAVCNKAGWPEEFTVPNAVLQSNAGVSRKEFDRARQMLTDLGRIHYKKSHRVNNAGKYSINNFPSVQKVQRNEQQEGQRKEQQHGQPEEHHRDNERDTLFKQDLTKQNNKYYIPDDANERLRKTLNDCKISGAGIDGLNTVYSYLGEVEIEVIEKALAVSENMPIKYFVKVINGYITEGKTTAESIKSIPKAGDLTSTRSSYNGFKKAGGTSGKPSIPIFQNNESKPISDDDIESMRERARRLDEKFNK
jgi:hypothetical protein